MTARWSDRHPYEDEPLDDGEGVTLAMCAFWIAAVAAVVAWLIFA